MLFLVEFLNTAKYWILGILGILLWRLKEALAISAKELVKVTFEAPSNCYKAWFYPNTIPMWVR